MAYVPTVWVNHNDPAINADHLNHIEQGIVDAHAGLPVTQPAVIAPANGNVIDAEARTAIGSLIAALQAAGIMEP